MINIGITMPWAPLITLLLALDACASPSVASVAFATATEDIRTRLGTKVGQARGASEW